MAKAKRESTPPVAPKKEQPELFLSRKLVERFRPPQLPRKPVKQLRLSQKAVERFRLPQELVEYFQQHGPEPWPDTTLIDRAIAHQTGLAVEPLPLEKAKRRSPQTQRAKHYIAKHFPNGATGIKTRIIHETLLADTELQDEIRRLGTWGMPSPTVIDRVLGRRKK